MDIEGDGGGLTILYIYYTFIIHFTARKIKHTKCLPVPVMVISTYRKPCCVKIDPDQLPQKRVEKQYPQMCSSGLGGSQVDLLSENSWQRVVVSAWALVAFALAAARLLLCLTVACSLEPATVFQQ